MQRGRKSVAELTAIVPGSVPRPVQPPHDLAPDEKALFRQLVRACPHDHFCEADRPLLTVYVEAVVVSRRAARRLSEDPAAVAVWEKSARLVGQLASKLRLCPSSRIDARAASRRLQDHLPYPRPWEESK